MSCFPKETRFKYPWRSYQQRVLDDLDTHMNDEHLHVVAPPGSGKTVLGLEVMLRIDKPTLILAPTLTIRNQWIQRFCELFLSGSTEPDWISRDARHPKRLTVVTYQGLHAACNNTKEDTIEVDYHDETDVNGRKKSNFRHLDMIVKGLQEQHIQTIILDEAHHLKNEWWQTLSRIKDKLQPKIVGLTATPPYDVSPLEWSRYIQLNGAIDTEISVPELIREKDLCPHQDYVYLTSVTAVEHDKIKAFRQKAEEYFHLLSQDEDLIQSIESHPAIIDPLQHEYYIFENLTFYTACLIFLKTNDREISPLHFELMDIDPEQGIAAWPELDYYWMQELLQVYFFEEKGYFAKQYAEQRETWLNRLRRGGVIEHKTIRFDNNNKISKRLSFSISKLQAIEDIVNFEYADLGSDLRQVILADFVRKEYLSSLPTNDIPLKKIGVVPIFEQLRRHDKKGKKIGILTGSLLILPSHTQETFFSMFATVSDRRPTAIPLPYDPTYYSITIDDQLRDTAVRIVTDLFQSGQVEILIGTKALLGEGWDAPAINSLILASFVGSFVLSNQMRGRAIRTHTQNPYKTSNIWHIASVDPISPDAGHDVRQLRRRFRNFVGISDRDVVRIENGLERVGIHRGKVDSAWIAQHNAQTIARAERRSELPQKWQQALLHGTVLLEEIKIPFFEENSFTGIKKAEMKKTIGNMATALGSSVLFYLEWSTQITNRLGKFLGVYGGTAMMGILGVGTVVFGARALRTFSYYTRYRDVSKDIYGIGIALVKTLCKSRLFTTPLDQIRVLTYSDAQGAVYCHLDGGTAYEKSLFVQMIQEIVDPVGDPRYIIIRKSRALKFMRQTDYHAVPEQLAKKAALAQDFLQFWQDQVGDAELIFTKSAKGRKVVLKARIHALANHFNRKPEIEHRHIWS